MMLSTGLAELNMMVRIANFAFETRMIRSTFITNDMATGKSRAKETSQVTSLTKKLPDTSSAMIEAFFITGLTKNMSTRVH
jgi:hypothetical protein